MAIRVSQEIAEVLVTPTGASQPDLRVSQLVAQVLITKTGASSPSLRMSQLVAMALVTNANSQARVTQYAVEVLHVEASAGGCFLTLIGVGNR